MATWIGPIEDKCNLCGDPFKGTMYDARVPHAGWANICQRCFIGHGCSVGTGQGQKYRLQADGQWLKVAG